MKKVISVMFILLVLMFCSSAALADDTKGIYVGVLGGMLYLLTHLRIPR